MAAEVDLKLAQSSSLSQIHAHTQMQAQSAGVGFDAPSQQAPARVSPMAPQVASELQSLHAQHSGFGQGGFNATPVQQDPFAYIEPAAPAVEGVATPAANGGSQDAQSIKTESGLPFPVAAPTLSAPQAPDSTSSMPYIGVDNPSAETPSSVATSLADAKGLNIVNVASEAIAQAIQSSQAVQAKANNVEQLSSADVARARFLADLDKPISEVKNIRPVGIEGGFTRSYRSMFSHITHETPQLKSQSPDSHDVEQATSATSDLTQISQSASATSEATVSTNAVTVPVAQTKTTPPAEFTKQDIQDFLASTKQGREVAIAVAQRLADTYQLTHSEHKVLLAIVETMLEHHHSILDLQLLIAKTEQHYRETLQNIEAVKNQILKDDAKNKRLAEQRRLALARSQENQQGVANTPYNVQKVDFKECPDFSDMPFADEECPPEYRKYPEYPDFDDEDEVLAYESWRQRMGQAGQSGQGNQGGQVDQGYAGSQGYAPQAYPASQGYERSQDMSSMQSPDWQNQGMQRQGGNRSETSFDPRGMMPPQGFNAPSPQVQGQSFNANIYSNNSNTPNNQGISNQAPYGGDNMQGLQQPSWTNSQSWGNQGMGNQGGLNTKPSAGLAQNNGGMQDRGNAPNVGQGGFNQGVNASSTWANQGSQGQVNPQEPPALQGGGNASSQGNFCGNWSPNYGQGSNGGFGQGNFNQGGQANHGFGHAGFNTYDQNEPLAQGNFGQSGPSDNSPQGRNHFRPQKVDPTLGQGNFNNLDVQGNAWRSPASYSAQVEDLSSNQAQLSQNQTGIQSPLNQETALNAKAAQAAYAMSADMGGTAHNLSSKLDSSYQGAVQDSRSVQDNAGAQASSLDKAHDLDLSEISPNTVANLEQRIIEKAAIQDQLLQEKKQRLKELATQSGLTEAQITLDLDPEKYDIDGLPYDDFAKYDDDEYEPFAYPETLADSNLSMSEIGLGPEGGKGEGFNLPSKQQRALEASREAALQATLPETKDEQAHKDTAGSAKQDSAAQGQDAKDIYTGRKTNLPQVEDYGTDNLGAHAVSSIEIQNASLEDSLNLNLRPAKVIDDELEDREFFTNLFANAADFIFSLHQAKVLLCTDNVNTRKESKNISSVLDNLADDMIRARDIQRKLAAGEITQQEAEIAMGRVTPEQQDQALAEQAASATTEHLEQRSPTQAQGQSAAAQGSDAEFSLAQQGVGGMDVNDPRYLGAKLVGSVSLQAQKAQAKNGERSAVDPEGLIAVPDFSSAQPLVLQGQDNTASLTQDVRSAAVSTDNLNETQPTGGTVGETPASSGSKLTLDQTSVPALNVTTLPEDQQSVSQPIPQSESKAEQDIKQPEVVSDVSSDFNPQRAQTTESLVLQGGHGATSALAQTTTEPQASSTAMSAHAPTTSQGAGEMQQTLQQETSSSEALVEHKKELELKPSENTRPVNLDLVTLNSVTTKEEAERLKALRQQQAQNSLNSLVSSIRAQEGHGDFNIDDIFGSSLSDEPAKITLNDNLALHEEKHQVAPVDVGNLPVIDRLHDDTQSSTVAQDKDLPPWELQDSQLEQGKLPQVEHVQTAPDSELLVNVGNAQDVSSQAESQASAASTQSVDTQSTMPSTVDSQATAQPAPVHVQDTQSPTAAVENATDDSSQGQIELAPKVAGGFLPKQNILPTLPSHAGLAVGEVTHDHADRCAVNLGDNSKLVKWGSSPESADDKTQPGKIEIAPVAKNTGENTTEEKSTEEKSAQLTSVNQPASSKQGIESLPAPTASAQAQTTVVAPKKPEVPTLRSLLEKFEQSRDPKSGKKQEKFDSIDVLDAFERQINTEIENKVTYAPAPWSLVQSAVVQIGEHDVPLNHMDMPAPVPVNRNNQIGNLHKFEEEVPFYTAYMDSNVGFNVSLQDLNRETQASIGRFNQRLAYHETQKQEWEKLHQADASLGEQDPRGMFYLNAGNSAFLDKLQKEYADLLQAPSQEVGQAQGDFIQENQEPQATQGMQARQGVQSQWSEGGKAQGAQGVSQGTSSVATGTATSSSSEGLSVQSPIGQGGQDSKEQGVQGGLADGQASPSQGDSVTRQNPEQASQEATDGQDNAAQDGAKKAKDESWDQGDFDDFDQGGGHTTQDAYIKSLEALDQHDSEDDDSTEHTNFTSMELDLDAFKESKAQGAEGEGDGATSEPNTSLEADELIEPSADDEAKHHKLKLRVKTTIPGKRLLNQDDYLQRLSQTDWWYKLILTTFPDKGLFYGLLVNVECQVDPQDAYHWRLLVDKEQEIGGFSDKIWHDVQERLEQQLNHKLTLEFELLDAPSPRCPAVLAEQLAQQAVADAKQTLHENKGLTQLMDMIGENLGNVDVELYVATTEEKAKGQDSK